MNNVDILEKNIYKKLHHVGSGTAQGGKMEIGEVHIEHPDGLITSITTKSGKKYIYWIPYPQAIHHERKAIWNIEYNGGTVAIDLTTAQSIMLYGAIPDVPGAFLTDSWANQVAILAQRRNIVAPFIIYKGDTEAGTDLLSAQVMARKDGRRRSYVARTIVAARLASMRWIGVSGNEHKGALRTTRSVLGARTIEAEVSRQYWDRFYKKLEVPITRRESHPINTALDACSHFMIGIILRWIQVHHLSPSHGYLHERTEYHALAYDLIEPYRYMLEQAVYKAWGDGEEQGLVNRSINELKIMLEEKVFVPVTRQTVTAKHLLHGMVLALRAYLVGDMRHLIVPIEGERERGRPVVVSYQLPGRRNEKKEEEARSPYSIQ